MRIRTDHRAWALLFSACMFHLAAASPATEWVRAGLNTNQPVWGIRGGLQFAIAPGGFSGGQGGPRGLIRIGHPTLPQGRYDLINFIAVEPIVATTRGFSELEQSRIDGRPGKLFWTGAAPAASDATPHYSAGELTSPAPGVTELAVPIHIEKFDNGAHLRLVLSQRSDAPDELRLKVVPEPGSAPMKSCILTATMGNKARTRLLWLKEGPVSSLRLFGSYEGADFTRHAVFPLAQLPRDPDGDILVAITTDEENPAAATGVSRFWQYRGHTVTQYWRKRAAEVDDSLRCAVNARFKYWMSSTEIPGGLAYENFELVQDYKPGQEFVFGVTKRAPNELASVSSGQRELISDSGFRRGFALSEPKPGRHVQYGTLPGLEEGMPPAWRLLQWSSRYPLDPKHTVLRQGEVVSSNAAKLVGVTAEKELVLAANSAAEYGPRARTAADPWVHLLVEQEFEKPAPLAGLKSAKLHVEARLMHATNLHHGDYSAAAHAAQFQIFFTVQNRNSKSRGYGDLLWFGVPIYDNRSRSPAPFKAQDFGGTGKFIFTAAGESFTKESAHDGRWITIDKDLLPLMREGLEMAWAKGFLGGSRDLADYAISGMNMGWELPGTFDVQMQVRALSLTVVATR